MPTLVLPVRDVVQQTPRTRSITVDLAGQAFPFLAGQAVFAGLSEGTVRRPYSIACSPTQSRETRALELLVQIDDHESPDPHLELARPGTPLHIEGPFGTFGLPSPLLEPRVLFIAGGTGIAPLRSMMNEMLSAHTPADIGVIYSARSPEELAYREELMALAAAGRIDLHFTVTRNLDGSWTGSRGRVDQALIRTMLKTTATRCLVCGPPALVSHVSAVLTAEGVAQERIVWEAF